MNVIRNEMIPLNVADIGLSVTGRRSTPKKLHRVATARHQQGVSLRNAARHMDCTVATARTLEDETRDLSISELVRWATVLQVPLQDLLIEPEAALSKPIMERAQLLRLMKTAAALKAAVKSKRTERLASQLVQQLVEIMPELEHIPAWNSVGQRRSRTELGRVVDRVVSDDLLGP